jgi:hypothetical protein
MTGPVSRNPLTLMAGLVGSVKMKSESRTYVPGVLIPNGNAVICMSAACAESTLKRLNAVIRSILLG